MNESHEGGTVEFLANPFRDQDLSDTLAGAPAEAGLPRHAIPIALLFFDLGVEIGQVVFVAAVLTAGELFCRATVLRLEGAFAGFPKRETIMPD